jgi:hypothetical protein
MGPGKRKRSPVATPGGRQAKRPRKTGQLNYARITQEGIRMAIVCEDYPGTQITKDNFGAIQKAVGQLVDGLPEWGFTPMLLDTYCTKGAAIMVCQNQETIDWLARLVPTLTVLNGSRLKVVDMKTLPAYKRVAAWFPGPVEDTETLFQRLRRLNRGLETWQWRTYERKEEPSGVRLVLSIDQESFVALERMEWRPFSGVGQATFSLLGAKPEGKK